MTMDPRKAAQTLRELAIKVEAGEIDEVFLVTHKVDRDGNFSAASESLGGTNLGAAYAIDAIADHIECCTNTGCLPGTMKLVVQGVMFDHDGESPESKTVN